MNLAMLVDPGLLVALIPFVVIFLGVITFEVAMGVTISTLPRSRFRQRWTAHERQRVARVFCVVFGFWPTSAALVLAHLYAPLWAALIGDAAALAIIVLCFRWLAHGIKQRNLILAGHCANCYYDLRASKDRDHCPECGVELHDHPTRIRQHRPTVKARG